MFSWPLDLHSFCSLFEAGDNFLEEHQQLIVMDFIISEVSCEAKGMGEANL